MIDGITLLNTYTEELVVKEYIGYNGLRSVLVAVAICILLGVIIYSIYINEIDSAIIMLYLWCLILLFGVGFLRKETVEVPTYQVLINEKVSMTEFNEKYEIIKQEGLIYTIREKDWREIYGNS